MNNKPQSVIAAIVAMSAAGLATQLVAWHTFPKVCLAGGVAGIVMAMLLFTLLNKKSKPVK